MIDNKDALSQFGARIGLPNLKLDAERLCELTVGDGLEIAFEGAPDERTLRLNGRVGAMPSLVAETLRAILVANYNGQATGASALAVDPVSGEVILGQGLDTAALDAAGFSAAVETFLKYLSFWKGHLPTMAAGNAAPASSSLDDAAFLIRA